MASAVEQIEAKGLVDAKGLASGDLAELLGAFNDVTARLQETHDRLRGELARLEGELREANERLARSRRLAALGEMAAGIAHEVRNPLSSIGLYARMLDQDLADRPGERATARKIGEAVRGLDRVVGDVLAFAREVKVRAAPVEACALLASALERCGPVSVRVAGPGEDGPEVECDPSLLGQALVNIVRNALEAMAETPPPRDGHELTLWARNGGGWVTLGVGDTGPGVDPGVVDRMFNPFFTTRATGTGLGLAIVHRIVDAHGGRIVVGRGGNGRGATFELHLPARWRGAGQESATAQEALR